MFRKALDGLYHYSGVLAAACICAIVVIVFCQVCLNLTEKIYSKSTGSALGLTIPSYADFTGFLLAAASFLALAATLRAGAHIRVSLLTNLLPQQLRHRLDAVVLTLALALSGYAGWYMFELVLESRLFNDQTHGMIPIPLWLPQVPVLAGIAILSIALLDELIRVMRGQPPSYAGKGDNLLK